MEVRGAVQVDSTCQVASCLAQPPLGHLKDQLEASDGRDAGGSEITSSSEVPAACHILGLSQ